MAISRQLLFVTLTVLLMTGQRLIDNALRLSTLRKLDRSVSIVRSVDSVLPKMLSPTSASLRLRGVHSEDPASQCDEGVQLFHEDQRTEALPLLEAGFTNREEANFDNPEDLGLCALILGLLRDNSGDRMGALEAYAVALQIFQDTGNRQYEATTLNNIGAVHRVQGQYEEALEAYRQAQPILHDVGDLAGEANVLNGIGAVHEARGQYEEALDVYRQTLSILDGTGHLAVRGTTYNNIGAVYYSQGQYEEALNNYQEVLRIRRETDNRTGEGSTLNNMAAVYEALGRYDEALDTYYQALAIRREIDDRPGEATTLNGIGAVYFAHAQYGEALDAFQQALTIHSEVSDRSGEASALSNMGAIYQVRGQYDRALSVLHEALVIRREIGDRNGEAVTLNNIGTVYESQGRYDEALAALQQALVIRREIGDRFGEGNTLNNLGVVYEAQGRYSKALEVYAEALSLRRQVGEPAGEATTLRNIGDVRKAQGRMALALELYQQSLEISRAIDDRAGEGDSLSKIGVIYSNQGRYAEALSFYQQSLAIIREIEDPVSKGEILNNIGLVHSGQGRYEEALDYFRQAVAIHREVGNREAEGGTLHNISTTNFDLGRLEEALDLSRQALSIAREIGDRPAEGTFLRGIGAIYDAQERYDDALSAYQQGLDIAREVGDRVGEGDALTNIGSIYREQAHYSEALANLQRALDTTREVGNHIGEGRTLTNIGQIHHLQGSTSQALTYYVDAMEVVESVRTTAGSEVARTQFIAQHSSLYQVATSLYLEERQQAEAFFTSERSRARAFLDSLATGYVKLSDGLDQALLAEEQRLYRERQALQKALARARAQQSPDMALIADLEDELANVEASYQAALDAIAERGDELVALIPGRSLDYVLEVEEAQALLDKETTLISYYLYHDITEEERALAFIITQDEFQTIPLPAGKSEITDALVDFRQFSSTFDPHPESLQQLYRWLIAPLVDHLDTLQLLVVPHDVLHYLPFSALSDGEVYLGDRYALTTLPSASALPLLAEGEGGQTPPLIVGNPETGADLTNLPAAAAEAQAVADLYNTSASIESDATETLVKEGAEGASILHIAAHASFNSNAPLQSALQLASDEGNDGQLHMDEVYGLNLEATDLVVLSACETQVGRVSAGDDIVALNRAFLFTGAPTVMASLWNVDDTATSLLMTSFYSYLNEGWGAAEALRQAQGDLRTEHPEYAHPFYWAAFVLSGKGGDVTHFTPSFPEESEEGTLPERPSASATQSTTESQEEIAQNEGGDTERTSPFCFSALIPLTLLLWLPLHMYDVRKRH